MNVSCIFDVGKTNKKVFLFNDELKIIYERSVQLPETIDEDGFPCEDVHQLTNWVLQTWQDLNALKDFHIHALNFSAYGASFVFIDDSGQAMAPLCNYLKPYPQCLLEDFYEKYGQKRILSVETASPSLGNLNSGLQLYMRKHQKPEQWSKIRYAVHLPQYLSSLFTNKFHSDITSIGCHTALWNFQKNDYHDWVYEEDIHSKLPPIVRFDHIVNVNGIDVGPGLHDSSAALIPYMQCVDTKFLLISTGTWNISLNPFNDRPLNEKELEQDCLCYLAFDGRPVKASRLFAGNEHESLVRDLADRYNVSDDFYRHLIFDASALEGDSGIVSEYHKQMAQLVGKQVTSTNLVLNDSPVGRIYVDGGFGNNDVFMHLLALSYPSVEVYAAKLSQASALGAAMAISKGRQWKRRLEVRKVAA